MGQKPMYKPIHRKILSWVGDLLGLSTGLSRRVTALVLISVLVPLLAMMEYLYAEYTSSQHAFQMEKAAYRHFYVGEQQLFWIARVIRAAMEAQVGSGQVDPDAVLQATDASFVVFLDRARVVEGGRSRSVPPESAALSAHRSVRSRYVAQVLPGTREHQKFQQEHAASVPTVLPGVLADTPWGAIRTVGRGCSLAHLPILAEQASQLPFGFERFDEASLRCLGIADQLANTGNQGLVLLAAVPRPGGGLMVGGVLLNNLNGIGDRLLNHYAIKHTTLFLGNRAVLTTLRGKDGRAALGRIAPPEIVASVADPRAPYSHWPTSIGDQMLQEWYIPLFRDAGVSPSRQMVGMFGYAMDEALDADLNRMHVLFVGIALGSVVAVLFFKTPLTRLLVNKELQVERNHRKLEAILATVSQGIVVFDRAGVIRSANAAAAELTGWQDLAGQNVTVLFEPNFAARLVADLFAGHHQGNVVGSGVRCDGTRYPCECTTAPLELEENLYYLCAFCDISERLEIEEERQRLAVASERNRLALEIHDTLAQYFALICWRLEAAMTSEEPETALAHHRHAAQLAEQGRREARRSLEALRPDSLDYTTFWKLLESYLRTAVASTTIAGHFRLIGAPHAVDPRIGQHLCRIGQEAIHNAIKHAGATGLWVEIAFGEDSWALSVRDDGRGFASDSPGNRDRFGLQSMRARARALGGALTIESMPDAGTTVRLCLTATSSTQPGESGWVVSGC